MIFLVRSEKNVSVALRHTMVHFYLVKTTVGATLSVKRVIVVLFRVASIFGPILFWPLVRELSHLATTTNKDRIFAYCFQSIDNSIYGYFPNMSILAVAKRLEELDI